jgi:hypothetical protein
MEQHATHHIFDPETFVYSGSVSASGVKGAMPPLNSTTVEPKRRDGYFPVWHQGKEKWEYVEDHRGEKGWLYGKPTVVNSLGPLPDGWSLTPPPPPEPEPDPEPDPLPETPPDTRTPEEKRRAAYRREADPIRQRIEGYRIEAEAWRLEGNENAAAECDASAAALLTDFLAAKEAIRERYPDAGE